MTPDTDLATLREMGRTHIYASKLHRDRYDAAVKGVEAEIARLRQGYFQTWEIKHLRDEIARLCEERDGAVENVSFYERELARLQEGLRRIANRYCLHTKGDRQDESACLDKPPEQWCSVCIARALLAEDET